jgi:hypothetical protein
VEQLEGQDVPEFEKRWSRYARPVNSSWRCDEVLQPLSRPATEKKNSMSAAVPPPTSLFGASCRPASASRLSYLTAH